MLRSEQVHNSILRSVRVFALIIVAMFGGGYLHAQGHGDEIAITEAPLIVMSNSTWRAKQVFQMGSGACLRGPLWFKDDGGRIIFQLADGIEYPTGCGRK